jgi:murein DD-endopeptidase MepM/ murein hydrolase activator NlpD
MSWVNMGREGQTITSPVWGNVPYPITQDFGVIHPQTAPMYPGWSYTEPLGWPAGTHLGIDIAMNRGTKIYAAHAGKVEQGGPALAQFFRPHPVYLRTEDDPNTQKDESGYLEIYGHLWQNVVNMGDRVTQGQFIGYSGEQTELGTMTPDQTGAHLHFELHEPGHPETKSGEKAVDPYAWLTGLPANTNQGGNGKPNTSPTPLPSADLSGLLAGAGGIIADFSKRGLLVIVGAAVLIIGLISVIGFDNILKFGKFA